MEIKRTINWINKDQRIRVRYDRLIPIQHTYTDSSAAITYLRIALPRDISLGEVFGGPITHLIGACVPMYLR